MPRTRQACTLVYIGIYWNNTATRITHHCPQGDHINDFLATNANSFLV
jgi:hypothetical protein